MVMTMTLSLEGWLFLSKDLDSIVDTILEEETERLSDTTHCSELFREKTAATARPVVTYLGET